MATIYICYIGCGILLEHLVIISFPFTELGKKTKKKCLDTKQIKSKLAQNIDDVNA